jgi:hypothetical protein
MEINKKNQIILNRKSIRKLLQQKDFFRFKFVFITQKTKNEANQFL